MAAKVYRNIWLGRLSPHVDNEHDETGHNNNEKTNGPNPKTTRLLSIFAKKHEFYYSGLDGGGAEDLPRVFRMRKMRAVTGIKIRMSSLPPKPNNPRITGITFPFSNGVFVS